MKRIIALLSALSLTFGMFSCGEKSDSSAPESSSVAETTEKKTTEEKTEPSTEPSTKPTTEATSEPITEVTTETTTEAPTEAKILSSSDYVTKIGESIDITDITTMAASSIGALNGTSFMYNGNKFEIYRFDEEHSTLASAADGTVTINIAGWGEYSTNSSVNGEYMMIYSTVDETVIQAFNNAQ